VTVDIWAKEVPGPNKSVIIQITPFKAPPKAQLDNLAKMVKDDLEGSIEIDETAGMALLVLPKASSEAAIAILAKINHSIEIAAQIGVDKITLIGPATKMLVSLGIAKDETHGLGSIGESEDVLF
jgi:hypothetical protein